MGALRMTPVFFHLLLSLWEGAKHGYALMQEVGERTDGRVRLGPGSLYYALGRLEEEELIEESTGTAAAPHAERRRYYRLTRAGRKRLREEAALLADIVAHARLRDLIG
jgi:DNA-binding PadR family transcriptional regulator